MNDQKNLRKITNLVLPGGKGHNGITVGYQEGMGAASPPVRGIVPPGEMALGRSPGDGEVPGLGFPFPPRGQQGLRSARPWVDQGVRGTGGEMTGSPGGAEAGAGRFAG